MLQPQVRFQCNYSSYTIYIAMPVILNQDCISIILLSILRKISRFQREKRNFRQIDNDFIIQMLHYEIKNPKERENEQFKFINKF